MTTADHSCKSYYGLNPMDSRVSFLTKYILILPALFIVKFINNGMNKILIGIMAFALLEGCASNVKNNMDTEMKYPALNVQNMDTTIKPGDDFFDYVNGTWLKTHPVPADKNSISAFDELMERNRTEIREIIADAAADKNAEQGSITQKIGTFYNTGMDTVSIEEQGIKPIKKFFEKIDSITNTDDLLSAAAIFSDLPGRTILLSFLKSGFQEQHQCDCRMLSGRT